MRSSLLAAGVAAALTLGIGQPALSASPPPSGRLDFDVTRGGQDIGDHRMGFSGAQADFRVEVVTNIAVRIPLIRTKVYSYEQQSVERWHGGQLVHVTSRTDEDGEPNAIDADVNHLLPGSLWSVETVAASRLVNTIDGSVMAIRVDDLGGETIGQGGRSIQARHYRISGDLDRDVWYDADGYLARLSLVADDGSTVIYVRR